MSRKTKKVQSKRTVGKKTKGPTVKDCREIHARAVRFFESGDFGRAQSLFLQVLQIDPDHADALHLLGGIAHQAGEAGRAVELISKAVSLAPENPAYRANLGLALIAESRFAEAAESCRAALRLMPDFSDAHNNLGNALIELGKLDEAVENLRRAIRLEDHFFEAHHNLGNALVKQGKTEAAAGCYRKAFQIRPLDGVRMKLATLLPPIYRSMDELKEKRAELEKTVDSLLDQKLVIRDPVKEVDATNFYLAYQGMNDREIQVKIGRLLSSISHSHPLKPPSGEKIRVGFISKYFKNHTMGKYFHGIIEELSRKIFEVIVFSIDVHNDELGTRIKQNADAYVRVNDNWQRAQDALRSQNLDILFFTDIGMDPMTYYLASSRFAPVQCATWGHPVTTGRETIDYFLSSKDLETEESGGHYSEELVRLDDVLTYFYRPENPGAAKSRTDFGLPENRNMYLCPQTFYKIHPEFDALLGEILRRDPQGEAVLICAFHSHWSETLTDRFRRTIPDVVERIRILPRLSGPDFLAVISLADAVLDTIHFAGGVSSYEAFSMGAPIVTLPSGFMRGRMTYALYRKMGVMDCVPERPGNMWTLPTGWGPSPISSMPSGKRYAERAMRSTSIAERSASWSVFSLERRKKPARLTVRLPGRGNGPENQ